MPFSLDKTRWEQVLVFFIKIKNNAISKYHLYVLFLHCYCFYFYDQIIVFSPLTKELKLLRELDHST